MVYLSTIHVAKYTSPMDPMGMNGNRPLSKLRSRLDTQVFGSVQWLMLEQLLDNVNGSLPIAKTGDVPITGQNTHTCRIHGRLIYLLYRSMNV